MYDLNGKVALVTGTSNKKGIGRALALRLAQEGADVIVSDKYRGPEDLDPWDREEEWRGIESLAEEIEAMGRRTLAINADLLDSREIDDLVAKTVDEFGKIDILVNNAGIIARDIGRVPVVELSKEAWDSAIGVNLTGTFLMCKAVGKEMIKQNAGGKIINMSSIQGKRAFKNTAAYSTSKFGVIGLTQTLALELASYKINVNAVCPGVTASWGSSGQRMYDAIKQGLTEAEAIDKVYVKEGFLKNLPLTRPASVEDVANIVAFLASSQADYMTGQAINVTGGLLMEH